MGVGGRSLKPLNSWPLLPFHPPALLAPQSQVPQVRKLPGLTGELGQATPFSRDNSRPWKVGCATLVAFMISFPLSRGTVRTKVLKL